MGFNVQHGMEHGECLLFFQPNLISGTKTKVNWFSNFAPLSPISNMKFIFFILSGTSDMRGTKANLIMTVFQSPIKV